MRTEFLVGNGWPSPGGRASWGSIANSPDGAASRFGREARRPGSSNNGRACSAAIESVAHGVLPRSRLPPAQSLSRSGPPTCNHGTIKNRASATLSLARAERRAGALQIASCREAFWYAKSGCAQGAARGESLPRPAWRRARGSLAIREISGLDHAYRVRYIPGSVKITFYRTAGGARPVGRSKASCGRSRRHSSGCSTSQ
jgi:hypothetical protein